MNKDTAVEWSPQLDLLHSRPSTGVKEGVAWPAARGFPLDYLRIGNYEQPQKSLLGVEKGLLKERLGLWRELKSIGAQGNKNHHNEL